MKTLFGKDKDRTVYVHDVLTDTGCTVHTYIWGLDRDRTLLLHGSHQTQHEQYTENKYKSKVDNQNHMIR